MTSSDVATKTVNMDAARELGSNHDVARYITKLKAMTNPTEYAKDKLAAIKVIQTSVNTEFAQSYSEFYNAGLSQKAAKENAMRVAEKHKEILMQIHEESYPSGANMIEKKQNKKQSKLIGLDD